MRPCCFVFLLILMSLFSVSTFAQDKADLDQCVNSGTTQDQVKCLQNIYGKEDARLNMVYSKALAASSQHSKEVASALKKSEIAWIKLRDEWCSFQQKWEQSTLGQIAMVYCMALQSRERADELTFYADGNAAIPMLGRNSCDCMHDETPLCSSVTDLYAQSRTFRTKLLAAFKAASIRKPDWVPKGLQTAGFPASIGTQKALLGYLGEPHNAPHQLAVVFTCSSGRVAGAFIEDARIHATFGKPSEVEIALIKEN